MKELRVTMAELKVAVLKMHRGGARKYGKRYFRPTLKTQVRLLWEKQGIKTSIRTLCRAIRGLIDKGYLWRKNRCTKGKGIKMICRATAYYVLDKANRLFRKMIFEGRNFLRPLGVPSLAYDKVTQEPFYSPRKVLEGLPLMIHEKDGSVSQYFPSTGTIRPI